MAILISGNKLSGGKTGILLPSDANVTITSNDLVNFDVGIHLFDPALFGYLGLPKDAPIEQVVDVVDAIKAKPNTSNEEAVSIVSASRLGKWLGNAETVTKVATSILELVKSGSDLLK
ncbi:hypothetical protein [Pseudomonas chlororaphis]|uniref:hypothetical protein n=1 Tax=Pseudomonas chlororaphis TaxID=587753 RepID=UPI0012D2F507|nr:hypothetical protein [Pseudomonas chlororaphis]